MKRIQPTVAVALALIVALSGCDVAQNDATSGPTPSRDAAPTAKPTTEAPASTVEPVITIAAVDVDGRNVSFSGYVSGIVEDDGSCEFTSVHDDATVIVTAVGAADRSTTSCGLVSEPIESFTKGTWTITLSYSSDSRDAAPSQSVTMEIP